MKNKMRVKEILQGGTAFFGTSNFTFSGLTSEA